MILAQLALEAFVLHELIKFVSRAASLIAAVAVAAAMSLEDVVLGVTIGLAGVFALLSLAFCRRRRLHPIQERFPLLVLFCALLVLMSMIGFGVALARGLDFVPCFVSLWLLLLLPLASLSVLSRAWLLLSRFEVTKDALAMHDATSGMLRSTMYGTGAMGGGGGVGAGIGPLAPMSQQSGGGGGMSSMSGSGSSAGSWQSNNFWTNNKQLGSARLFLQVFGVGFLVWVVAIGATSGTDCIPLLPIASALRPSPTVAHTRACTMSLRQVWRTFPRRARSARATS